MAQHRIAIDAMGSDLGPDNLVPACKTALHEHDDITIIMVGDEAQLKDLAEKHGLSDNSRISIVHAAQVVEMTDSPVLALKKKKDSSMRVAINLVHNDEADAAVSAGNTGALMATAKFVLKTVPGIKRPAICTSIPALRRHTHMLDLGANIDSTAEMLYQYGLMGSALCQALDGDERPRVGLLNIGQEELKGNDTVKEASALLEASTLNYVGFVEGDDIYTGDVDVVVCDGFIGNVALKTSEGLAKMISHNIRAEFTRSIGSKLAALFAAPVLNRFRKRIDSRRYNGASLLGLRKIVIKSHGSADALAFANAIGIARLEVIQNIPTRISQLSATLDE